MEFDLLRGGHACPCSIWPDSPYTLLVARAKAQLCRDWRAHSLRPLPPIPVPLSKPDQDIALDLQPMIGEIYQRFRYMRSIDYSKPLTPPLDAAEELWLVKQLRIRGASDKCVTKKGSEGDDQPWPRPASRTTCC